MQLQKAIDEFKALDIAIISVHREEQDGVEGLEKTASETAATFHLASDLGSKSTAAYSVGGFHSYLVHKDGRLLATLKGTKNDRPTPEKILAKARAVLPDSAGEE